MKWKVQLDKKVFTKDTKQSFYGSQNLSLTVASGVCVELDFDLEGEKTVTIMLQRDAVYKGTIKNGTTDGLFKHTVILQGEGTQAQIFARLHNHTTQTHEIDIVQHHIACHTSSVVDIRSVLDGSSRTMYKGLISIEDAAQDVQAHQEYKVLILSQHAQAVSVPSLEVKNNQVQCGHGTALAYLDRDLLFSLASRGISEQDAKKMLIKAFLAE